MCNCVAVVVGPHKIHRELKSKKRLNLDQLEIVTRNRPRNQKRW
jgi:hypothetical protein